MKNWWELGNKNLLRPRPQAAIFFILHPSSSILPPMSPIDCHIHIVGNGARGSGCWIRLKGRHRWLAAFMLRHLRLPPAVTQPDFDEIYVERLLALIRESSLGSAVVLAQENVYDDRGTIMEGAGSFYVP